MRKTAPVPKIVDHDARRQEYLEAMWRVVERDGAAAVSTRSVAAEAGYSKSNIRYYFDSQAALMGAAVEQIMRLTGERAAAFDVAGLDHDMAVRMVMLAIPDSPARRRQTAIWLTLITHMESNPELKPILKGLNRAVRSAVEGFVAALEERSMLGRGRDRAFEVERLHALIDGLSVQTMYDRSMMPPSAIRRIVSAHLDEMARPVARGR